MIINSLPKTLIAIVLLMLVYKAQSQSTEVKPINWELFPNSPESPNAGRWLTILNKISKNIVNETWDSKIGDNNLNTYFELGENYDPKTIRPFAQYSYALSVILALKQYNSSITNQSESIAMLKTITMIKSIAKAHLVNGGTYDKMWGNSSQSAHWAANTGQAAWLVWSELSPIDKVYVKNMVEYEANRFLNVIPVSANEDLFRNTRAEEIGWNAWILEAAAAMMPNHTNYSIWRNKSIEFRMTAVARKEDLTDERIVDGLPAYFWMRGYNVSSDYAVGNHQAYPHPDYSATTIFQPLRGLIIWSMADLDPPQACLYNQKEIYKMFVDKIWNDSSTIYKQDGTIYWPIEIEKERASRYYKYSGLDVQSRLYNTDALATRNASEWENQHLTLLEQSQDALTGSVDTDAGIHEPAFAVATNYLT